MATPTWPDVLGSLISGADLSATQSAWAMGQILAGEATPAQIGGFAVALRAKGETVEEITGLVAAMYERATPIQVPGRHGLAVEDREVDGAGVHVLDDDGLGGDLDVLELGQVRVGTAAEREDHLLARVDVVAVDEDLDRAGGGGFRHGRHRNRVGHRVVERRSARSRRRSSRAASLIDERTHWVNSTAKKRTPIRSPVAQRIPPARCWSSRTSGSHAPIGPSRSAR